MDIKILIVDDDENILEGYRRSLRPDFKVLTALSPKIAFDLLQANKDISVIVSDFKMPTMNGVEFLSHVKNLFPDIIRILFTGYADVTTAINAVNEGNIFRLLTKPCKFETLKASLIAANRQYELITAERELLDKTVKGSIKVLVDILALVNPKAFKHANQMRTLAAKIGKKLNIKDIWELEVAALLSQIGCVTIPVEILNKMNSGEAISDDELKLYLTHPKVGKTILENIPRLQNIANIINYQLVGINDQTPFVKKELIQLPSKILNVLNDYYFHYNKSLSSHEAFKDLMTNKEKYDNEVLIALDAELAGIYDGLMIKQIELKQLVAGVVIADDIKDQSGYTLVTRGSEITEIILMKLQNYSVVNKIIEPIRIFISH